MFWHYFRLTGIFNCTADRTTEIKTYITYQPALITLFYFLFFLSLTTHFYTICLFEQSAHLHLFSFSFISFHFSSKNSSTEHRCKKTFLRFYFKIKTRFNVFFIFPTFFINKKTLANSFS